MKQKNLVMYENKYFRRIALDRLCPCKGVISTITSRKKKRVRLWGGWGSNSVLQHSYTVFFQSPNPAVFQFYGSYFTDFPGLPSGASDALIFWEESKIPVFPLHFLWLFTCLTTDYFPLSPSISFHISKIQLHLEA